MREFGVEFTWYIQTILMSRICTIKVQIYNERQKGEAEMRGRRQQSLLRFTRGRRWSACSTGRRGRCSPGRSGQWHRW